MKKRIAVVGAGNNASPQALSAAERIGADIAGKGCVLVCGGKNGVMEAASLGAKEKGGLVVGILPSLDACEANRFVDVAVTTGMGYARNALVVSSADAVIVVGGSYGTLSEAALALNFRRPVVSVEGTGGVADGLADALLRMGIKEKTYSAPVSEAVALAVSLSE